MSLGEPNRWNWIEHYFNISAMVNRSNVITVKVDLFAATTSVQPITGAVYFDNVCLEAFRGKCVCVRLYVCAYVCAKVTGETVWLINCVVWYLWLPS